MTRDEFVRFAAEDQNIPKSKFRYYLDVVLEGIFRALEEGNETIHFPGFGVFEVRLRKGGKGRNMRTGETVDVPPKKILTFRPADYAKEAVQVGEETNKAKRKRGGR